MQKLEGPLLVVEDVPNVLELLEVTLRFKGYHVVSAHNGVEGLEKALLRRPELFVGTLTEKLLTFALGRGIEPQDAPAVREIVRRTAKQDFRFSEIIVSIVTSPPFTMRTTP